MAKPSVKVVLDTNILISAVGFGGKPHTIFELTLNDQLTAVTSPILLAELADVVSKRFSVLAITFKDIDREIRKKFQIVEPQKSVHLAGDESDNRVLEAGEAGNSQFIITGDQHLLKIKKYKDMLLLDPAEFIQIFLGSYAN
ncbi:putative toxin-antitoxin system toxin component, PIN family [Patescibacteria group bacterium]|nr:putative toxin-antitoxin system toxin component, PIN family [Patescibacteria group bacterium]